MTFEAFEVVVVPFPFTDRSASRCRPALILSDGPAFNLPAGYSVMAMIISQQNTPWPLDVSLPDLAAAGLPSASVVRMKLFSLDHRLILRKAGLLAAGDQKKVKEAVRGLLLLG